jgi:cytochrome P450 PksS
MGLSPGSTANSRSAYDSVNIASPAFKANPFPFYARLRAESPVHRMTLPTAESAWLITRYDDVVAVLKDDRLVKDPSNAMSPGQLANQRWFRKVFKPLKRNMLNRDPPDHTRLRGLVKAFSPKLIEQMRGRIETLTNELLDGVQLRNGGRMDLIRDFALPLPATVIAELLGVPVEDRHAFHRGTDAIIKAGASSWGMVAAIPSAWWLIRYIRKLVKKRRADPRDDLVSVLAQPEEAGDMLSEDELIAMVFLLLVAGHETTVNLIGNGTLALLENSDQMEKLRGDPALIKPAVEELLRYTSPVEMATERYTREDVTIAGVTIPRGEMVFAVLASANRDERQFDDPDRLDITREPNKHVAFGLGPHFCLGAPLARLEGQIAINPQLRRAPDLRLASGPNGARWRRGLLLRGLESLPVTIV